MNTPSSTATTEEMVTLKPCPFCDADETRIAQGFVLAGDVTIWSVECKDCGAERASDESQAEADAFWNTRPDSAGVPDGLVERHSPHSTIVEDDEDGFLPVEVLAGSCVYLWQGGAQITVTPNHAQAIAAALSARPSPPKVDATTWPDIGEDPMKGDRSADRYETSVARVRQAYVKQQSHVPNQTALVWRYDIGTLLEMSVRLQAIVARDDARASPTRGAEDGGSVASQSGGDANFDEADLFQAVHEAMQDELSGKPDGDILIKGCEAAGYDDPESAADAFKGDAVKRIIAALSHPTTTAADKTGGAEDTQAEVVRHAEKRGEQRAVARLVEAARAISFQAGVGGRETAGAIVSYLATSPDEIAPFVAGTLTPLDFNGDWMRGGCLTWHGINGQIVSPAALQREGSTS